MILQQQHSHSVGSEMWLFAAFSTSISQQALIALSFCCYLYQMNQLILISTEKVNLVNKEKMILAYLYIRFTDTKFKTVQKAVHRENQNIYSTTLNENCYKKKCKAYVTKKKSIQIKCKHSFSFTHVVEWFSHLNLSHSMTKPTK